VRVFRSLVILGLLNAAVIPLSLAQQKRVAVMPLKDRTNSGSKLNIGQKVADELMSKLTDTGQYQVYTRDNLDALAAERGLKFDADFDPKDAPRSGLQKVCDYLVTGQIEEFSQNQTTTSKGGVFSKSAETDGTVALKITVNVLNVTTGQNMLTASARSEQSAPLTQSGGTSLPSITSRVIKMPSSGTTNNSGSKDQSSAMLKLVDASIAAVSDEVAQKIEAKVAGAAAVAAAAAAPPTLPKFAGMADGLAMISRGARDGIRVGQTFDIVR
jgi:curli biogenesis system outer membrane secretion channel CsgG